MNHCHQTWTAMPNLKILLMHVFLNGNGCHLDTKGGNIWKIYAKQNNRMQSLHKKIAAKSSTLHNLAKLKWCKTCDLCLMRIKELTCNWNCGQKILSQRWKASLPGFVHKVKCDAEQHKFVCICAQKEQDVKGNKMISTEEVVCTYDYIAWMCGNSFAKCAKELSRNVQAEEMN